MRIPSITFSPIKNLQNVSKVQNAISTPINDSFIASTSAKVLQKLTSCDKLYTCKDYELLTQADLAKARALIPSGIKEVVYDNIQQAFSLKKLLDFTYEKHCYNIVSIGTSPAPIARVFECMNINTKFIPISQLGVGLISLQDITEAPGFNIYKKFLKEQGFSFFQMLKNPKKTIFYDYTHSGQTLKLFEELMHRKLHVPHGSCEYRSLAPDLLRVSEDDEIVLKYFKRYLEDSEAEIYGGVPHLPWRNNLGSVYKVTQNPKFKYPYHNQYLFALQDKIKSYNIEG